jgi:polysaccharide deacetylase 2 family uncharacterized protein YibQ
MADDLSKPLLGPEKRQRKGLTPGGIVLTVLAVVLIGIVIWVVIVANPGVSGGDEPSADGGAATVGEVVITTPETMQSGVVITTPGGEPVDGNGAVIRQLGDLPPVALSPTADPALLENGPYGQLPKIGADGFRPFDAYARPPDPIGGQPVRVAIVVGGIGINQAGTEMALAQLPGAVTLALAPYGSNLATWAARSREAGHELLLQVPFEPIDFPQTDPGPQTLIAADPAADNVDRLRWLMSQFQTYAGIISYTGGRFLTDTDAMAPVVAELARRGLMFVDDGAVLRSQTSEAALGHLPFAKADLVIDVEVNGDAVAARLAQLVAIARDRGYAIGSASAFPVTIEQIARWAETLDELGVVLVPVTSLANDPLGGVAAARRQ